MAGTRMSADLETISQHQPRVPTVHSEGRVLLRRNAKSLFGARCTFQQSLLMLLILISVRTLVQLGERRRAVEWSETFVNISLCYIYIYLLYIYIY